MSVASRIRRGAIARGICFVAIAASLFAARSSHAAETAAPGIGAGNIAQLVFGLAVVLGLIVAAGWFMKRFQLGPSTAGLVKVLGGASIGQRERVVVVEVGDTWMVLGVAPGRVNALHTMPRGELGTSTAAVNAMAPVAPTAAPPGFSAWLKETMEKRRRG